MNISVLITLYEFFFIIIIFFYDIVELLYLESNRNKID